MTLLKVAKISEIPAGSRKVVPLGDSRAVVFNVAGRFYAIEDVCTHDDASLDNGPLLDFEVECPRHGARFDVRTGAATRMPAIAPVRTFSVRTEGEDVVLEAPDA